MSTSSGAVHTTVTDGIARLSFSHPAHNSMPSDLLADVVRNLDDLSSDQQVKVIVFQSGGERTFCAGASFDELLAISNLEEGKAFFSGFASVINAMRRNRKLIIGRAQGKAVGGGVGLLAACDYCLATQYASVKLSELTIGIGPFVILPAVERKIGLAKASQLSIDACNWYDSQWAAEAGLFQGIYEDLDSLNEAVDTLAQSLATYSSEATTALKRALWQGTDHWDELLAQRAEVSGQLVLGEAAREALERIKGK
ncbi:MAG: enoyl-CoA hydratase/isomerase family protein [Bacteroidota bacterium]